MKTSRSEARDKISSYFSELTLSKEKNIKMKRLAMRFKLPLGKNRARFCQGCYADLRNAKIRVSKTHKIITCACGKVSKIKIS